jgi:hypothetical protein
MASRRDFKHGHLGMQHRARERLGGSRHRDDGHGGAEMRVAAGRAAHHERLSLCSGGRWLAGASTLSLVAPGRPGIEAIVIALSL